MRWSNLIETARHLEQAIIPNCCVFCGTNLIFDAVPICTACHVELPWVRVGCELRSLPMYAPLDYAFPVDVAIKALKFRRKLHYVPALAAVLIDTCDVLPEGIDGLLPVPLHWWRQLSRGFNQAEELARPVQRHLGRPVLRNVTRFRATPFQSGLGARERHKNLRGAFSVRGEIHARHVLIVDDVVTTGATCAQLAAVLFAAGVEEVSVLAIARATMQD